MALTRLPGFIIDSTSSFTFAEANVTGNLVAPNISSNNSVNFIGASNVSLGPVGNVKITGGTADYVLSTDGTGNLSWVAQSGGGGSSSIANGTSNVNIATSDGNVTTSVGGTSNVVVVTSTGINVAGTFNTTGNANIGNIGATNGVFTNVSGNGSGLSAIAGGNVTGQVANALVAGTVYTNAQPNITSVGTLTDLNVSGNAVFGGNLTVDGNLVYVNVTDLAVEDPIIQLQTGPNAVPPSSNSGKDIGTALNYYDTSAKIAFMGWDVSNAEFGFGNAVSIASEVVTFTSYGNVRAGYFIGNGSQLTGITAAAYANYISNGTSNVNILTADGNVTISVNGTANVVTVTNTGINVAGTLNATGNANVGNISATSGVFTNVSGNGSALSSITGSNVTGQVGFAATANSVAGANVSGQVGNALVAGTVYTAAQPNITSVGTLSSLAITGNVSAGNANLGNLVIANFFSGDGSLLSSITGSNVTGTVANATHSSTANTVTTAAQPNITSLGTLTGLTSNGVINFTDASNVSLGAVGNLKITGGSNGYMLTTNGSGSLSWSDPATATSTSTTDSFTGNGVATSFTLSVTPASIDWTVVNYNGVIVLRSDYTLTGNVIEFANAPANLAKIEVTTVTLSAGGGGGGSSTAATVGYALVFGG